MKEEDEVKDSEKKHEPDGDRKSEDNRVQYLQPVFAHFIELVRTGKQVASNYCTSIVGYSYERGVVTPWVEDGT